jgi:tetratricopeptide (TPR) repeat protein
MSSFMSSFIILIAVLVGVTVVVALLSVAQLRIYSGRQVRKREEEVAEQVKRQLADLRNARPPQQKRFDQGNYDVEHTAHEAGQRNKESTGEAASRAQGTVGQDAHQRRATEAETWSTFHRGSVFDRQGEYDLAVEAYQRVIDSEHAEAAPRAAFNLGILFEERGEYDRAEKAYQWAIDSEHAEWAPKAAFDLGILFENRGEYDLAVEAYQRAIDSGHPEEAPRAALNLGLMLYKLGEYDRAKEAYQRAIDSGLPEIAPKGLRNLRGLPMRFLKRIRQG